MTTHHPGDIVFARHGHAFSNSTAVLAGRSCKGLTAVGAEQAVALAQWLAAGPPITRLYASTTLRAYQTARTVARQCRAKLVGQPQLAVPDPGSADGMSWNEARARWPMEPSWVLAPPAPDAESWSTYLARSIPSLRQIFDEHDGGRTVIVGHSETLSSLFCMLLDVTDLARLRIGPEHCAVTIWRPIGAGHGPPLVGQRWALTTLNSPTLPPQTASPGSDKLELRDRGDRLV